MPNRPLQTRSKTTNLRVLGSGVRQVGSIYSEITTPIANTLALLTPVAAAWGVSSQFLSSSMPRFDLSDAIFAIRFVIFVAISGGLGWSLGLLVNMAAKPKNEVFAFLAWFLGFAWGCLLVFTGDWLSAETSARAVIPQFAVFMVIGMMIIMRLLVFQFRVANSKASTTRFGIELRSAVILIFAATSAVMYLVTEFGDV